MKFHLDVLNDHIPAIEKEQKTLNRVRRLLESHFGREVLFFQIIKHRAHTIWITNSHLYIIFSPRGIINPREFSKIKIDALIWCECDWFVQDAADAIGILLPKLFWPTVRKNCPSDREIFWNSRQRIYKIVEITRTIYSNSESQNNFW